MATPIPFQSRSSESTASTIINEPLTEHGAGSSSSVEKGDVGCYAGRGTVDDPYVVRWFEGEKENPYNWGSGRRYMIVMQLALSMTAVAIGSSIYGAASEGISKEFGASGTTITLGLSLYVIGFATGPLLWGPFSEVVGRRRVYIPVMGAFVAFTIGVAFAPNIIGLLVLRFFAGFFGSGPLNNSPGSISDIFLPHERSKAMSAFGCAGFLGPIIGPIIGDFIAANVHWRWVFYVEAMLAGVAYAVGLFIPETYGVVLLREKAAKLTSETGTLHVSEYDLKEDAKETVGHKLLMSTTRPFEMLFTESIVTLFSIFTAFLYGVMYMQFGAFPVVFQEARHWSLQLSGLAFLGFGAGQVIGIVANLWFSAKYARDTEAAGGQLPPEARLPMACIGGVMLPAGMFWFAWTVQPGVHFLVPMFASALFGVGMLFVFMGLVNYLVDAYHQYAASALAANAVLRSLAGAGFPLFTVAMFHHLGNNWALTLLSFISLLLAPMPFVFYRYGPQIRAKSKYAPGHAVEAKSKQMQKDVENGDIKQEEDLLEVKSRLSQAAK